ncbi:MAG: CBS domain-containing protein [Nocardioidaceae bacterium]
MLVREVMTPDPITVRADTTVKAALALLDEHSITLLPVLSPAGLIVGVVGEADLIRDVVHPDARASLLPTRPEPTTQPPHIVSEVMNPRTLTVHGDTDLAEAADLMTGTTVKSLPVVDDHHHVVGMVSRRDIVRVLARSDGVVEQEVDALLHDLGVDWLAEVRDGVVTVTGPTDTKDRALAMTVASTVPGVVAVTITDEPGSARQ